MNLNWQELDAMPELWEKICFVILPIGENGSFTRDKANWFINDIVTPVMNELGLKVVAPQEITNSGNITGHIIRMLVRSKIVIANLDGLNPNVMYELGVRHSTNKPFVTVFPGDQKLPFDIVSERSIPFKMGSFTYDHELRTNLKSFAEAAINSTAHENPVTREVGRIISIGIVSVETQISSLYERMDQIHEFTEGTYEMLKKRPNTGYIDGVNFELTFERNPPTVPSMPLM